MTTPFLTDTQREYLRREPIPAGDASKLRLALRLAGINQATLATAATLPNQQLSRYVSGSDLLLSTAYRIADQFGLSVCDLWPQPPQAKRASRRAGTRANGRRKAAKPRRAGRRTPKAEAVAA